MKNLTKKTSFIAALAIAPSLAFASALSDLQTATNSDLSGLAALERRLASTGNKPEFLPRQPEDVLSGCGHVDDVFVMQPSLSDEVRALNACLEQRFNRSNKRRYSIEAEEAGKAIEIVVRGELGEDGSWLVEDLQYSVNKQPRNGKIHGWPIRIVDAPRFARNARQY